MWGKWQRRWSSPILVNNRKYRGIRPDVSVWPSVFQPHRRAEIALCRLRIGHTHLTHKFLLEGGEVPECAPCSSPLTVEHILVQCPIYGAVRTRNGLAGKSLAAILGEKVSVSDLVQFLKDINIFFDI